MIRVKHFIFKIEMGGSDKLSEVRHLRQIRIDDLRKCWLAGGGL